MTDRIDQSYNPAHEVATAAAMARAAEAAAAAEAARQAAEALRAQLSGGAR
ncbi:hypothetical protein [Streptomyces sp. NPDC001502]|uniref:hypothetical protein n=1 Tax=Streptomyces sp. NPDC001502 TaxID=3364578 RepID=UPI00368CE596